MWPINFSIVFLLERSQRWVVGILHIRENSDCKIGLYSRWPRMAGTQMDRIDGYPKLAAEHRSG